MEATVNESAGTCRQEVRGGGRCGKPATHRWTWPGNDERVTCEGHAQQAKHTADAMGFHLEVREAAPR